MKKVINIFTIISMLFIIVNIVNINISLAADTINPDDYKITDPTKEDAGELLDKVGIILGTIRNISAVVSVIVLMIIGLKYILGSVEEKANYKATMYPYIIGCIMAVAGTTLVTFIYNLVK